MQIQAAPVLLYQAETSEYCQCTSTLEAIANVFYGIFTALCIYLGPATLDPLDYFGFDKVCHVCLLPYCDAFSCGA